MRDILIDPNTGDFILKDGSFVVTNDMQYVLQNIIITINTHIGKWKPFPSIGSDLSPFMGIIMDSNIAKLYLSEIERAINKNPVFANMMIELNYRSIRDGKMLVDMNVNIFGVYGTSQLIINIETGYADLMIQQSTPEEVLRNYRDDSDILSNVFNRG